MFCLFFFWDSKYECREVERESVTLTLQQNKLEQLHLKNSEKVKTRWTGKQKIHKALMVLDYYVFIFFNIMVIVNVIILQHSQWRDEY